MSYNDLEAGNLTDIQEEVESEDDVSRTSPRLPTDIG